MTIAPERYARLGAGDVLWFVTPEGREAGRLLYCWPRINVDDDGVRTLVPHRVGYMPIMARLLDVCGQMLPVESVHLGAGRFRIEEP